MCIKFPHKVITAKNIVVSYWYVYKGDKHYRHKELIEAINDYRKALDEMTTYSPEAKGKIYDDSADSISSMAMKMDGKKNHSTKIRKSPL